VFGVNTETPSGWSKAKSFVGLVPQEFNFGVFDKIFNIVTTQAGYYGVKNDRAKEMAEFYLKKLDLWDKRNEQARNLSGGMKRRLMIARALVHEPQILILDEPTAGVDIEIRRTMWDFLKELNKKGITIILTTHYLEEAECLCRNVAIINQGKIIENAPMKNLLEKLHQENFILDLREELDNVDLEKLERSFPQKWQQLEPKTIEIEVPKSQTLNHVFSELTNMGIDVLSLKNKANRLEELFLKLTRSK
jgi:ABC-2 type transport system ATP-binding protein